jgi:formylglycine-generating enzyme required for sulfatase activity
MDGDDDQVWRDEYPKHEVVVDSFWMDVHEVTNAQLAAFVKATDYMTIAEKAVDWEEIKKNITLRKTQSQYVGRGFSAQKR